MESVAIDIEDAIHPWVVRMRRRVGFGLVGSGFTTWNQVVDRVQLMEAEGFDSYWCPDHPRRNFSALEMLSAIAAVTTSMSLGTLVSCVYYRHPFVLAKGAADVDRVSGGRLVLGLGVGDDVEEFSFMGLDFPPLATRYEALDQTISALRQLWEGKPCTMHGQTFSMENATIWPVPQRPIPLLIAGAGNRALRRVAELGDVSNFGPHPHTGAVVSAGDVQDRVATIEQRCIEFGRPPKAVLRSHIALPLIVAEKPSQLRSKLEQLPSVWDRSAVVHGTVPEVIGYYRRLQGAGIDHFVAQVSADDDQTVQLIGREVLPALRA